MTLQEVKDQYAKEYIGHENATWEQFKAICLEPLEDHMDDIARRYAKQCVKASLWKAYTAAEVTINGKPAMGGYQVERESIINDENIML